MVHVIRVSKPSTPGYESKPFLMRCSCGTEGRFEDEDGALGYAQKHCDNQAKFGPNTALLENLIPRFDFGVQEK